MQDGTKVHGGFMKKFLGLEGVSGWQMALNLVMIATGSLITSTGINAFLVPHKFLSGGATGLSQLLSYLTPISVGTFVLILNVPIFAAGYFIVGRRFIINSAVGMLSLAAGLYATAWMAEMSWAPERLLSALIGGALSGGGTGLVFRANSSHGGIDIVSAAIRKRWSVTIGTVSFIFNAVLVVFLGIFFGLHTALYTVIVYFCSALSLDRVMVGLDKRRMIFVVSSRPEEIARLIMEKLGRGVTFLDGEGAYTGRRQRVIYCVVAMRQLARVKHYVRTIDPDAFVSIAEVSEVTGRGFKALPI